MQNITKPSLEEIHQAIIARDTKDAQIDRENRIELVKNGLNIIQPKKIIKIDTGKVIGVPKVVDLIKKEVAEDDKIIAVEGESGCGKSSTAKMLAEEFETSIISASDVFRYLTFVQINNQSKQIDEIIAGLEYKLDNDRIYLFQDQTNITNDLHSQLHTHEIDLNVAHVASRSQAQAIRFLNQQIHYLSEKINKKIIFEGRAFTLDFLPCDLRVVLFTDVDVRAKRRMEQER